MKMQYKKKMSYENLKQQQTPYYEKLELEKLHFHCYKCITSRFDKIWRLKAYCMDMQHNIIRCLSEKLQRFKLQQIRNCYLSTINQVKLSIFKNIFPYSAEVSAFLRFIQNWKC